MYLAAVDPLNDYWSPRLVYDGFVRHGNVHTDALIRHYLTLGTGEETDAELALAFGELASLDMKPAWPFLLHLNGDYSGGRLSKHDLLSLTRRVTAYAMRRAVCGFKTAFPPGADADRYVESVRAFFLNLPDRYAFLSDNAFRAELATRNMYLFEHRDTVLERLENHGRRHHQSRSLGQRRRAGGAR